MKSPTRPGSGTRAGQGSKESYAITMRWCRRGSRRSYSGGGQRFSAASVAFGGIVRTHHDATSSGVANDGRASVPGARTRRNHRSERISGAPARAVVPAGPRAGHARAAVVRDAGGGRVVVGADDAAEGDARRAEALAAAAVRPPRPTPAPAHRDRVRFLASLAGSRTRAGPGRALHHGVPRHLRRPVAISGGEGLSLGNP